MTEWKHYVWDMTVPAHRTGWLGVWDALMAAITRKPRITYSHAYTCSAFIKYPQGICDVEFHRCE